MNKTWSIDYSHTKVGFSVRHFGITETDGFFRNYSAEVSTQEPNFSDLKVHVSVQTNSIDTNDAQRDAHLKSEDFFFSEKFPELTFNSTALHSTGIPNKYFLEGNLTIRDITKPVRFHLEYAGLVPEDPFGNTKAGFLITGSVNRKEFGLAFHVLLGTGNLAVSDEVQLKIPIQLVQSK